MMETPSGEQFQTTSPMADVFAAELSARREKFLNKLGVNVDLPSMSSTEDPIDADLRNSLEAYVVAYPVPNHHHSVSV
jgi:hypothetical protein